MATNNNFLCALPDDEVLHLATPTMTSSDPDYPTSLVTDFSNGGVCPKPSLSTAFADSWTWAFGTLRRVKGVWLWHNADPGIILRVQMNNTNVWSAPTMDVTVTAPAKHKLGFTRKLFVDMTSATGYSDSGFNYLRIVFPNNTVPPGIKALGFSQYTRLDRNVMKSLYNPQMQSAVTMATPFNNEWVYKLPAVQEAVQVQVKATPSDQTTLKLWHEACGRGVACCAVNTDPTYGSPNGGIIGRIASVYSSIVQAETGLVVQIFDQKLQADDVTLTLINFAIRELTAGMPEWT